VTVRFAWPAYGQEWAVWLTDAKRDGQPFEDGIDSQRRRLRLDHAADWASASFRVTATTDEPAPTEIEDLTAVAILACARANTRVPFQLTQDAEHTWSGELEVHRASIAGTATLTVELAAQIADRKRLVGGGEGWTIIADASNAPSPPGKPPFETAWLDFQAADAPFAARQQPEAYAVMDLSETGPRLLLNEGIDGLKHLLLAPKPQLERRRVRELIATSIANQAAAALMRAAANEVVPVDPEDEVPELPAPGLYAQMCQAVAGQMATVASPPELYDRLVSAARGTPLDYAELWGEIDSAIDRLTGRSTAVATVVGEVKHV
jgi:hypothetical protein